MKRNIWKRLLAMGCAATLLMTGPGTTVLANELHPEDRLLSEGTNQDDVIQEGANEADADLAPSANDAETDQNSPENPDPDEGSGEPAEYEAEVVEESDIPDEAPVAADGSYAAINVGTETTATVTETDPEARFLFTPEKSGRYIFYSLPNGGDTYGDIYDSEENVLYSDDDSAGDGCFKIIFDAEAGKSLILAARYYSYEAGSFKVIVEKEPSLLSISAVAQNTVLECTNGYIEYGKREWFYYYPDAFNPIYTVITEAGEYKGNASQIASQLGYTIELSSTQSEYNEWGVGKHTVNAKIGTIECDFEVEITASDPFEQSVKLDGLTISASAEKGAFPSNAVLSAELLPDTTKQRLEEQVKNDYYYDAERYQAVSYAFRLDVKDENGKTLVPEDGRTVRISVALTEASDANITPYMYNYGEKESDGGSECSVGRENGILTTDTYIDQPYFFLQFAYGKLHYSLKSGTEVQVSDMIEDVGLTGTVTNVKCDNTELLSASSKNGKWVLKSLKPFSFEEWIQVTINGLKYKIAISDADIIASGEMENGLRWVLDTNGLLTISGNGNMTDTYEQPWLEYRDEILAIHVQDGVKDIHNDAFRDCSNLTDVTIASSVTSIGDYAFANCGNLKDVKLSEGLQTIGSSVFESDSSLTTLTLPGTITSLGSNMISGTSIQNITIPKKTTEAYGALANALSLDSVSFAEGIKKIPYDLFSGSSYLYVTNITIPAGVTEIEDRAFAGCSLLQSVKLPDSLEIIGSEAFEQCAALKEITLPTSLKYLRSRAFSGCSSLTTVNMTDNDTLVRTSQGYKLYSLEIENNVFEDCVKLKTVNFSKNVEILSSEVFIGCRSLEELTLPDNLSYLGTGAFQGTKIASIKIPVSLTTIEDNAFYGASYLSKVSFAEGTKTIPDNCLSSSNGTSYIKTVVLPESVTKIGYYAFYSNENLEEINIPANVARIGEYAFADCEKLASVTLNENNSVIRTADGDRPFALEIEGYAFANCKSLESLQLPDSVVSIGDYAFSYTGLSELTLGKNLKTIGSSIIAGTRINTITVPASVINAYNAFDYTSSLNEVIFADGATTVPAEICNNGFGKNRISSVILPEGLKQIESRAFAGCTRLTSISIPQSVSSIDPSAFEECSPILYVYKSSYAELWAIENGFKYQYLNGEIAEDDDKVLDMTGTTYYTNADITSINSYIPLYLKYKVKKSDRSLVKDMTISISLSPALDPVDGTLYVDNTLISEYEFDESSNRISMPVDEYEGEIQFYVRPVSTGQIASYATLNYYRGNEYSTEVIGTISLEVPVLTMQAPAKTGTVTFEVSGLTEPKKDINLYIDDKKVTSVTSRKDGAYSTVLTLPGKPVSGQTYQVKASLNGDSEIYSSSKVMYVEDAPELLSFKMYYNNNSESVIDLFSNKGARQTVSYVPGTPLTFKMRFSNADKLERVFVGSSKGVEEKKMEAKPSGKTGEYVASGFFDKNDQNYLPGTVYVMYQTATNAYESIGAVDFDGEEVSETWKNPDYDRRVNDDTNGNYEGTVTNNDGDSVDYEIHTGTPEQIAEELMGDTSGYDSSSGTSVINNYSDKISSNSNYSVIAHTNDALVYEKNDGSEYGYVFTQSNGRKLVTEIIKGPVDKGLKEVFKGGLGISANHAGGIATGVAGVANAIYCGHNTYVDINKARSSIALNSSMTSAQKTNAIATLDRMEVANGALTALRLVNTGVKATLLFTGHPVLAACYGVLGNMMESIGQKYIDDSIKYAQDGKNYYLKWLIDPSGYVYEAVTDNFIENAQVTAWYKADADAEAAIWDAEEDGQSNPLYTDKGGYYAWDTPEGLWQVVVEKPGYETWKSEWLTVPPVQTDVNAALISQAAPFIEWYQVNENQIEIQFSQFMDPESVKKIAIKNAAGKTLSYTLEYDTSRTDAAGKVYADYYEIKLNNASVGEGERCDIVVPENVVNYAGKAVATEEIRAIRSVNRVMTVQSEAEITYTKTVTIPISVTNADAETVVMAESSSPVIAKVVSVEPSGDGTWIATVYGAVPGTADIIISINNSAVSKVVSCTVINDGQAQDAVDVDSISISAPKQQIGPQETLQLTASVLPDDADNKTVIWATDKSSIATIDSNGLLTALHGGTVQVVARALQGNAVAVYTIYVSDSPEKIDIKDAEITGIKNKTYTGKAQTQNPVVTLNNKTLENGVDYTVSYENNKNAGTATIKVTGTGKYTGENSASFKINKAAAKLTFKDASLSKTAQDEAFVNELTATTDGTVTYKSGDSVVATVDESGRVTIKGIGKTTITATAAEGKNYKEGNASYELTVTGISIEKASVTGLSLSYGYSGRVYTPVVTVKLNGQTLIKDTDYTVKYENNQNPGTAVITVTGIGKYTGIRVKTFEIVDCVSTLVSGRTYQLIPKNNSATAVSAFAGRMVNNTKVYITDRSSSEAMKFKAIKNSDGSWKFINAKSELALAVQQNSSEVGKGLVLYDQTTKKQQNWRLTRKSDNSFAITNAVSGLYMAMSDLSAPKGTLLTMNENSGRGDQRFYIVETSAVNASFDGTYAIKASKNKAYGLNISSSSKAEKANVNLYKYSNVNAKKFKAIYSGGGYYRFVNVNSGLVLSVNGNTKASGANVNQSKWQGQSGQRWKIIKNSNGTVTLKNALGTVLHLNGNKTANGTNVVARKAATTGAQKWYMVKA